MLKKDLSQYKRYFTKYTELRVQENHTTRIMEYTRNVDNSQSLI
jgi:hypothetical protein